MISVQLPETMDVYVKAVDQRFSFDIAQLPPQSVANILLYGFAQKIGDYANRGGADDSLADKRERAKDIIAAIKDGSVTQYKGRPGTDPLTLELRTMVEQRLVAVGVKKTEAAALARKDVDAALRRSLEAALRALGKTLLPQQLDTLCASEMEKLETIAQDNIRARAGATAIDLSSLGL